MKSLITSLILLFSFSALAADFCSFQETWEFHEALKEEGIKTKVSRNQKRFNFMEKQMIHLTIAQQEWLNGVSKEEALSLFGEGPSDGEIRYFTINGKDYALVHYWPGDNEFGAFFELTASAYRLVASVDDSFITCK